MKRRGRQEVPSFFPPLVFSYLLSSRRANTRFPPLQEALVYLCFDFCFLRLFVERVFPVRSTEPPSASTETLRFSMVFLALSSSPRWVARLTQSARLLVCLSSLLFLITKGLLLAEDFSLLRLPYSHPHTDQHFPSKGTYQVIRCD